ncbi:hypothetical protein [Salinimicrobium sp. TH3]|uniref:hypothetical protein n=1 Tax=Salinimicrobium sp. TH3 TaxID=2997342 RepID=UPI0022759092|nr:hypothetical protein [Salinimicrobium sp. TH3]MCY2686897.1 hypothetical protein [Salinimicrobium sp. TH3]
MKKLLLLTGLFLTICGYSQEFDTSKSLYIGAREVRPSLSKPVKELSESKFTLMEVNFDKKDEKRQVNLIAMMEQQRFEKEKGIVEMESPMPGLSTGEKSLIEVTNDIRIHDRSSNFDIYTGKKKIPAYEEMQSPIFRQNYTPFSRRRYGSPGVYYNPYLR